MRSLGGYSDPSGKIMPISSLLQNKAASSATAAAGNSAGAAED